jgi:predicted nucleic acid-binding protein
MRLVLDTNVVISALLWRGAPYRLLETVRRQADKGQPIREPVDADGTG